MVDLPHLTATSDASSVDALAAAYLSVREDLEEIVPWLRSLGYEFRSRDPIPGPTDYLRSHRPEYVRIAEEEPPAAWDLFLQIVGPVDLCTDVSRQLSRTGAVSPFLAMLPQPWNAPGRLGSAYLDPFQVLGRELPNWRAPNGYRTPDATGYVDVCAETIQKAGYSGGGAPGFALPCRDPDPILISDTSGRWPDGLRFTELVRVSMAWLGLPGLRRLDELPAPLQPMRDRFAERYGP